MCPSRYKLIEALSGHISRLEITVPFYSEEGRSLPLWDERGGAHGELAQATAAFARYLLELRGFELRGSHRCITISSESSAIVALCSSLVSSPQVGCSVSHLVPPSLLPLVAPLAPSCSPYRAGLVLTTPG